MKIRVVVKGKEVKMTRKEYLRRFGRKSATTNYNDKMMRGNYKRASSK